MPRGRDVRIVKCACTTRIAAGVALLWGIRELFHKWAQGDPVRTDRVELLRQRVASQIVEEAHREQFLTKTAPNGRGEPWTPLHWFAVGAHGEVLAEIQRFTRGIALEA